MAGLCLVLGQTDGFVPRHVGPLGGKHLVHDSTLIDVHNSLAGRCSQRSVRPRNGCGDDDENVTTDCPMPAASALVRRLRGSAAAAIVAMGVVAASLTAVPLPGIGATDSGSIVSCHFSKCRVPLLKCVANPKCLANVVCINTCTGREDEIGCHIKCGDFFENEVVGEFNKCVVSDMGCVPQQRDEGLYPEPDPSVLVPKFDTQLWNGRW
jgi:hypothetical protein